MKIFLASDHAGFERKQKLNEFLTGLGYKVADLGPTNFDRNDDYPDFGFRLAEKVTQDSVPGIAVCGNGQGICIAANKVKGVRAVSAFNAEMAKSTRLDDNANILCLPGRFLDDSEIEKIVSSWLETTFSNEERHLRRLRKIADYES